MLTPVTQSPPTQKTRLPPRRYPIGAELLTEGGAHFRVWAPASANCVVELAQPDGTAALASLAPEADGYFAGLVPQALAGSRYRFRLDSGSFPDPASRRQPEGPHGPSEVVDPSFKWTDGTWRGRAAAEWVVYELHLGTFTSEGTWTAAEAKLPALAELGVTVVEVMPIAEFPGRFGWGYDGVDLFAPTRLYGTPADARSFVNRAHELGLMVILDVVYNHIGPDGNYLRQFSPDYFSTRYKNEWGDPMNFDGDRSRPVRELFLTNARYWIEEFHFDGLRFDATQQMFDASDTHVLQEIAAACRAAAGERRLCLVAENECQHARLVRPTSAGGYGLDALWNDDFHHAARVAATGRAEAYYSSYRGVAQELVSCALHGFLYQGQWCRWQRQRRGRPAFDLAPQQFIAFLQNHDQVANSLHGERLHEQASPAHLRALTALLLLGPQVPMLFQGQEFAASTRFFYFADHAPALAARVREGRATFLRQFPSVAAPESAASLRDPGDAATFHDSRLDWDDRERHRAVLRLHQDLLRLRRDDGTLRTNGRLLGAVLGERAFVLRFVGAGRDRLLLVNLGTDVRLDPASEPLLAPAEDRGWNIRWSSENPAYGGRGTVPIETQEGWVVPGAAAVWMEPDEQRELTHACLSEKA